MKEFIKFQIIYNFQIFYNSWFIPDCFSTFCLLSTISGLPISKRSGQLKPSVNCFFLLQIPGPKSPKIPLSVSVKLVGRSWRRVVLGGKTTHK